MNPRDLLKRIGPVSSTVAALVVVAPKDGAANQVSIRKADSPVLHEVPAPTAPAAKLVLMPAENTLLHLAGHSSHSSHASHSSHYSHRSGSYAPSYTPPDTTDTPPAPAPTYGSPAPAPSNVPPSVPPSYTPPSASFNDRPVEAVPVPAPAEHTTALTAADLAGKSDIELFIMRNELYARHGYSFPPQNAVSARLRKHFKQKAWYHPNTDDATIAYSRMSQVERHNHNLIARIEKQRRAGSQHGL